MKRFLALFAVMAMVVSMFSGVVFADELDAEWGRPDPVSNYDWDIEIDNDLVVYVGGFSPTSITGRAINADGVPIDNADPISLYVYKDNVPDVVEQIDSEWGAPRPKVGELDVTDHLITEYFLNPEIVDGFFNMTFLTDLGVGTYFVTADLNLETPMVYLQQSAELNPEWGSQTPALILTYDTFTIMYATELMQPTTLEWVYQDIPDTVIVQGMFPNEDSYDDAMITLNYQKDNGARGEEIAVADYVSSTQFGFLFDGAQLFMTGELGLYINGVLVLEGEVTPGVLDVTVSPEEAMYGLGDVTFTAEFNIGDYVEENDEGIEKLKDGYLLYAYVGDKDLMIPILPRLFENQSGDYTIDLTDVADGVYDVTFKLLKFKGWENLSAEDFADEGWLEDFLLWLELKAYWGAVNSDAFFVAEETTVEVEVVEPDEYNLMYWNDDPLKVGRNIFGFASDDTRPVVVMVEDGDSFVEAQYVEVILNGSGLEDKTFEAASDFTAYPTETGMVEVTINVHADDAYDDILHTFTRELDVDGWNVTITPDVVDVNSEVDITITITDEDGNPINNAIITSDLSGDGNIQTGDYAVANDYADEVIFDATVTNVVGGVYVIEYDDEGLAFEMVRFEDLEFWAEAMFEASGEVFMTATLDEYSFEGAEIYFEEAIEVVGLEVYTVTSNTAVLLEGFTEEIIVTPLDAEGDVIYPTVTVTYYDVDGDKIPYTVMEDHDSDSGTPDIAVEYTAHPFPGTRVDTDDDGVKESMEDMVTPVAGAVKALVRAESSDAKEYGEVELEVVKPQVEMTKAVNLTAYIDTEFEFTVVDPRDGTMMDQTVTFEMGAYTTLTILEADEDDEVYTATVYLDADRLVVDAFKDAAAEEEDVTVKLMIAGTDEGIELATILVLEPTLTSDPAEMIIGTASNLVLTYLDADGMPLEAFYVMLDGSELADTDVNGQVAYATVAGNTGSLDFFAETNDVDKDVKCAVPVTVDLEAPMATLMEANGMATITITDNVRVQKAMVNGVLVDMFYPAPTVLHMLAQADQYYVQAIDQNYNYLMVTLEGYRANMLTVVVGEDCGGFGLAEMVNEKTMVPVRYAEELGAVVTWDDATESVTYTIAGGEVVITVQIGNTTATVNGVPMEMAVAPYLNAEDRCMVPIRMIAQELGFSVDYVGGGTTYIY